MGCIDTVSHMIELTQEAPIFIPNVFTPNGDGLNDVFEVRFTPGTILGMTGTIWNRWGAKIYEFGSPDYTWWNGKSEEQDASAGVYFYIVEVIDLQNQVLRFNGTVTLLR
jgi:gliding motility-associated-like protein